MRNSPGTQEGEYLEKGRAKLEVREGGYPWEMAEIPFLTNLCNACRENMLLSGLEDESHARTMESSMGVQPRRRPPEAKESPHC